ncbi:MAG: hypothetical protein AABZ80_13725 [Gemmatimonadota bacterium]
MTLKSWLDNRWITAHTATLGEIEGLFAVVDRDLKDAAVPRLSDDWRLGIAYNAALQLATIALMAEGYRTGRERHHERALQSLAYTVKASTRTVDLLDLVRRKRNQANYEAAGATSAREAEELYKVVEELRSDVVRWLKKHHVGLCPSDVKA